ncbi:hypothetical protein HHK36_002251 [Tetracentron sinense]|uniref:Uncharacterized protein n=1 Tax=Tetracentron sinense TaxID=13715 RepID=A0A834ZVG1_TETSI|nr:hypothetical protein HHK36_002251 [Tetracentron sinense]
METATDSVGGDDNGESVVVIGRMIDGVENICKKRCGTSAECGTSVAFCDAGAEWTEDYISNVRSASRNIFKHDSLRYSNKEYKIELKPLFSAFGLRPLAMTSLSAPEERRVDLVVPLKKSVKQIIRETTVVTTRRVLERFAVHHVSQRMAWKLLKDVPKSAKRKAEREMSTLAYFYSVKRTTFRGHFLGVAASWLVQVGIEIYRCFSYMVNTNKDVNKVEKAEQIRLLGKKVSGVSVRCGASLIFASIGAGIGATLFNPSAGQWIGCAFGDFAGPIVVSVCVEKILHVDL